MFCFIIHQYESSVLFSYDIPYDDTSYVKKNGDQYHDNIMHDVSHIGAKSSFDDQCDMTRHDDITSSMFQYGLFHDENRDDRDETQPFDGADVINFPDVDILRHHVKKSYIQSYLSYVINAIPHDHLLPLSCHGGDDMFGQVSMTLFDSLPSLLIFGLDSEFIAQTYALSHSRFSFDVNKTVSLFETSIRILGGLVSAHALATHPRYTPYTHPHFCQSMIDSCGAVPFDECIVPKLISYRFVDHDVSDVVSDCGVSVNSSCSSFLTDMAWYRCLNYDGILLKLAVDLADRLMPAFATPTGLPFGSVCSYDMLRYLLCHA